MITQKSKKFLKQAERNSFKSKYGVGNFSRQIYGTTCDIRGQGPGTFCNSALTDYFNTYHFLILNK